MKGFFVWAAAGVLGLSGCRGDRLLRIDSVPRGAVVRLDDRVIGVTPLEVPFQHYGQRRLALYSEGSRTYSEPLILNAPWYARFPVDILTEIILPLGLDDVRELRIDLVADAGFEAEVATDEFLDHAKRARAGEDLVGVPLAGQAPREETTEGPGALRPGSEVGSEVGSEGGPDDGSADGSADGPDKP